MSMTASPVVTSRVHTPSSASPLSSPSLRPVASTIRTAPSSGASTPQPGGVPIAPRLASLPAPLPAPLPLPAPTLSLSASLSASLPAAAPFGSPRSYARGPPQRPYASPRLGARALKESAETDKFAAHVAHTLARRAAARELAHANPHAPAKAELIVDIPVWNPGCFTDLSTLHALRDTTLAHTHAIIGHLAAHAQHASYRLLARCPNSVGWGCIRLAPAAGDSDGDGAGVGPGTGPGASPRTAVRRTSFVKPERADHIEYAVRTAAAAPRRGSLGLSFEHAIDDDDDAEDNEIDGSCPGTGAGRRVKLRTGYSTASSDEDDDEEADVLVKREVERRGGKEGTSFVMILRGQPALILI
ncbi:hypothetical protein Q5752_001060 [Cryptotrichosporon argae]